MVTVPKLPKPKGEEERTALCAVTPCYTGGDINRHLLLVSLWGSIRVIPSRGFEKINSCLRPGKLLETGLGYNNREWFLTDLHQNNQASVNLQEGRIRGAPLPARQ